MCCANKDEELVVESAAPINSRLSLIGKPAVTIGYTFSPFLALTEGGDDANAQTSGLSPI
jgi:hypothetical protein